MEVVVIVSIRIKYYSVLMLVLHASLALAMIKPEQTPHPETHVKSVSIKGIELDKQGNFTSESLRHFLAQAYKENKLPQLDFQNAECLKVKAMVEEQAEAPWGTAQLFAIHSSCGSKGSYILKEMKDPTGEIEGLVRAATYPPLKPLIYPNKMEHYPQLIFPMAYLSYDYKGKKRQLSLMPLAPGKPLMSYMKAFALNPTDKNSIRALCYSFFDTGAAMARFYKKYMAPDSKPGLLPKSIPHGDLHAGNVFYVGQKREVILIDNERIGKSIEKRMDVCEDIAFLLMKSLFVIKWVNPELLKKFPFEEWYELYLPCFIAGYLSTYPKGEVKSIFEALKACVVTYKDPKTGKNWYADKEILKTMSHQEYMALIFERLKRWVELPFIASDSNVNAKDSGGKTILFNAVVSERLVIWPLIAAGADVNSRDNHNNTPLHDAAYNNKAKAIKVLVDAGADINAQDKNGDTPLHKAVRNGSKEAIKMLLDMGANRGLLNNKGERAID